MLHQNFTTQVMWQLNCYISSAELVVKTLEVQLGE